MKVIPAALPVFSVDTEEEAESLQLTFGSLVHSGPLAGRYVVGSINRAASDDDALAEVERIKGLMVKAYARMKERTGTV